MIIAGFLLFAFGRNSVQDLTNWSRKFIYTKIIPKSKKITIISNASNYKVSPETSDFAKEVQNDLNLFDDKGVFLHHRSYTEKVQIRELDIVFSDSRQFWPALNTSKQVVISNFDFTVDKTQKGTITIWINPDYTVDLEKLSLVANRTYFIALYKLYNWDVQVPGNDMDNMIVKVDDHIEDLAVEDRPIRVTNQL